MKTVSVTGHRPHKLPCGYSMNNPQWYNLINNFKKLLIEQKAQVAISGMAIGVDTAFAIAVLQLQQEGHQIKLICALPCYNQDKLWRPESKKLYRDIVNNVKNLDIDVVYVTKGEYNYACMQKRNEYLVDRCDTLIAVYDGSTSGTQNCIRYAKAQSKDIIILSPAEACGN